MYEESMLPGGLMVDNMIEGLPSFPPTFDDHSGPGIMSLLLLLFSVYCSQLQRLTFKHHQNHLNSSFLKMLVECVMLINRFLLLAVTLILASSSASLSEKYCNLLLLLLLVTDVLF